MQKVPITFDGSVTARVPINFDFRNPNPDQFIDFEVVEIIPLNSEGQQICASEFRNVILTHAGENGEASWFNACIKTDKLDDGYFNSLEAVVSVFKSFSSFQDVDVKLDYTIKVFSIIFRKDNQPFLLEFSFEDIMNWTNNATLMENFQREIDRL